jgi:insulysin
MAFLDPLKVNLTNIYVMLVRDVLTEYTYDAVLASLKWDIICSKYGLIVSISQILSMHYFDCFLFSAYN